MKLQTTYFNYVCNKCGKPFIHGDAIVEVQHAIVADDNGHHSISYFDDPSRMQEQHYHGKCYSTILLSEAQLNHEAPILAIY